MGVLELAHDNKIARHLRYSRTLSSLDRNHWKHKSRDIRHYCEECRTCQQQKDYHGPKLNYPTALQFPLRHQGKLSTDVLVQLRKTRRGFDAITIYVYRLLRKVGFIASRTSATAETVATKFFTNILLHQILPDALIWDRDSNFTSKFWKSVMSPCGVNLKLSSPHHSQMDGSPEAMNKRCGKLYTPLLRAQERWLEHASHSCRACLQFSSLRTLRIFSFWEWPRGKPTEPLQFLSGIASRVQGTENF